MTPEAPLEQEVEVTVRLTLSVPARLSVADITDQVTVNIGSALPAWLTDVTITSVREEADIYKNRSETH